MQKAKLHTSKEVRSPCQLRAASATVTSAAILLNGHSDILAHTFRRHGQWHHLSVLKYVVAVAACHQAASQACTPVANLFLTQAVEGFSNDRNTILANTVRNVAGVFADRLAMESGGFEGCVRLAGFLGAGPSNQAAHILLRPGPSICRSVAEAPVQTFAGLV